MSVSAVTTVTTRTIPLRMRHSTGHPTSPHGQQRQTGARDIWSCEPFPLSLLTISSLEACTTDFAAPDALDIRPWPDAVIDALGLDLSTPARPTSSPPVEHRLSARSAKLTVAVASFSGCDAGFLHRRLRWILPGRQRVRTRPDERTDRPARQIAGSDAA
jgi:hypothetical protein